MKIHRIIPEEPIIVQEDYFKDGIVGFFDILGFKHVADVQTEEAIAGVARLVEDKIVHIRERLANEIPSEAALFKSSVHSCIFADSILLWCEVPIAPHSYSAEYEVIYWNAFFRVCTGLMKLMFNDGFPLRGAISAGKFFVKDYCFVGRPIVQCYSLLSGTQWSGCIVAKPAEEKLQSLWSAPDAADYRKIMERVCVQYEVPWNGKTSTTPDQMARPTALVLKWFHDDLWRAPDDVAAEIPNAVRRSFQAHGKENLTEGAELKLRNTLKFLEFVDGLYVNSNTQRKSLRGGV
jgi:hypothetical protein